MYHIYQLLFLLILHETILTLIETFGYCSRLPLTFNRIRANF